MQDQRDIDNEQYFECLVGLVNAQFLEMNQSFLKEETDQNYVADPTGHYV